MLSSIESSFEGSGYAAVAGWLCLLFSLFFAVRRPAANVFLPMPFVGMGGIPLIGGYTYGRIAIFPALLTVLVLVVGKRQPAAVRFDALARAPLAWFAGVCLVLSVKIGFETAIYGLDTSRIENLVRGLVAVLFPSVVVLLSEIRLGPEFTARETIVGMFTYPILMMAGYLPFASEQGLLWSAWAGLSRFTFGTADTINSANVLTCGAIASLLLLSVPRKTVMNWAFRSILLLATVGFSLLVLLNGTRQYLLALVGFLLLWGFVLQAKGTVRWLTGIGLLVCLVVFFGEIVTTGDLELKERISAHALESEIHDSRGAIWSRAFESVLAHPVLGVGFKNFGLEIAYVDKTGKITTTRDSAHGLLQDVFTEHGIPLGIAVLVGCISLVVRSWRAVRRERRTTAEKALTLGLIALLLPLLFSGTFLNATQLYLLLIMAMARDAKEQTGDAIRAQQGVGSRKSMAR